MKKDESKARSNGGCKEGSKEERGERKNLGWKKERRHKGRMGGKEGRNKGRKERGKGG